MTDEFLLSRVSANADGWVPLATLCRFNKMKALTRGGDPVPLAAAALRAGCPEVEVDAAGLRVRRTAPLPDVAPLEVAARTCVAENLPPPHTHAALEPLFAAAGRVRMLRVCPPTAAGSVQKSTLDVVSPQTHALVEYETRAEAEAAVRTLSDAQNWRTGLRLRLVRREAFKLAAGPPAAAAAGEEKAPEEEGKLLQADGSKGRGRGKAGKKDYSAWASVGAHRLTVERERAERAAVVGAGAEPPAAPPPPMSGDEARPVRRFAPPAGGGASEAQGGPSREAAMPDGTRGFSRGRGMPLAPPLGVMAGRTEC